MGGETSLERLLSGARPVLDPKTYVFTSTQAGALPSNPAVIGTFREDEGLTLIAEQRWAESEGLDSSYPCRRITLAIHSSLEAVGLIAAVSTELAAAGISSNPVSAFYHDHLFVPQEEAARALATLERLVAEARSAQHLPLDPPSSGIAPG